MVDGIVIMCIIWMKPKWGKACYYRISLVSSKHYPENSCGTKSTHMYNYGQ